MLLLFRKTEYKTQKIHIQQKKVYEEAVPKSEHIANYPKMVLQLAEKFQQIFWTEMTFEESSGRLFTRT